MVLDRQCAIEAGKEFPNPVVGKEGHVNNCRILWPSKRHVWERMSEKLQDILGPTVGLLHIGSPSCHSNHLKYM